MNIRNVASVMQQIPPKRINILRNINPFLDNEEMRWTRNIFKGETSLYNILNTQDNMRCDNYKLDVLGIYIYIGDKGCTYYSRAYITTIRVLDD